jgi:hypothetical protein
MMLQLHRNFKHGIECITCESNEKCYNDGLEQKVITSKLNARETNTSPASISDLAISTDMSTQEQGIHDIETTDDVGETPGSRPPSKENHDAAQTTPQNTTTGNEIGNLLDFTMSEADRMMDEVYGDHVHQNPDQHLTAPMMPFGKTTGGI